jgi:hypothetical protein
VRQSIAILTLLSLLLILPACQSGATTQRAEGGKGEVAAVVNGTTITVGDVDRVTAQQAKGQESQLSQLEADAARLQALDGLVTQEVLYQRAKKENLTPTEEEVKQEIQRNKQESGMTEEAFKKQLEDTHQTEAQLQEDVRKQIAIRKLQDKVTAQLKVQDREIETSSSRIRSSLLPSPVLPYPTSLRTRPTTAPSLTPREMLPPSRRARTSMPVLGAVRTLPQSPGSNPSTRVPIEAVTWASLLRISSQRSLSKACRQPKDRALCKCVRVILRSRSGWCRPLAYLQAHAEANRVERTDTQRC